MSQYDGWQNVGLRHDLPADFQSMGCSLGVYVRMPSGTEPVYISGFNRGVSREDIRGAINFLTAVDRQLQAELDQPKTFVTNNAG